MDSSADFSNLGKWLPQKMADKGMSAEQLGNACGVSRSAIYFFISDKNRPTEMTMMKICRALDADFADGLRQYTPRPMGRPRL